MAETTRMQLADWLDDLTVRFLLNLPASELSSVPRLCFQVEEAQWFYEDFIRPAAAASSKPLPSLSLREFCLKLFQHCPLLSGFTDAQHIEAYEEFLAYKIRVPVRGAILMNHNMEKLVLVKGWKKNASWSFPRGKINKDEKDLDCAIREVWEETGYDVRQAGLVPENEDDAKYIEITMREQHMKLFIFRGVPEDTVFEPQTRKEISKIDWYNVRDLPGFKKHKQGVDQVAHANKFYMVAPFLNQLKKYINFQRRHDTATAANEAAGQIPEYESVPDQYYEGTQQAGIMGKSDELMRLLGSGGAPQPGMIPSNTQPQSLLAMLQGGAQAQNPTYSPQNVFGQPGGFVPQPHQRHPSVGYSGPDHHFPAPEHMTQQERNFHAPAPGRFDPNGNALPSHQQNFFGEQNPQFQPSQQHAHAAQLLSQFGNTNGIPFGLPQRQPNQPPYQSAGIPPHGMQQQHPVEIQGSQGAIGSGPSAPKAENLPMPKLNAHSANLLNALKTGNTSTVIINSAAKQSRQQAGTHQTALLDLFRKPSTSQPSPAAVNREPNATKTEEIPVRPAELQQRRPTLNEITRTLPKSGLKSPIKSKASPVPVQDVKPPVPSTDPPKSKQKAQQKPDSKQSKTSVQIPSGGEAPSPVTILQRPSSSHVTSPSVSQSPKPNQKKNANAPKKQNVSKGPENSTPTPQFTILPRPGSARSSQSPIQPNPTSPVRNATPAMGAQQQVHVLKRSDGDSKPVPSTEDAVPKADDKPDAKRDQLLSLFGKAPTPASVSPQPAAVSTAPAPTAQAKPATSPNQLLDLFNASKGPAPAEKKVTPPPPPAPLLVPERKPSHVNIPNANTQQNTLLGLFGKPAALKTPLHSPDIETPISPFALGTPVTRNGPPGMQSQYQQHYNQTVRRTPAPRVSVTDSSIGAPFYMDSAAKSRMNSIASSETRNEAAPLSRNSSVGGTSTPTEASKGFLLDFLNGVVKNEGRKG